MQGLQPRVGAWTSSASEVLKNPLKTMRMPRQNHGVLLVPGHLIIPFVRFVVLSDQASP